ncbi:MAG TPA: cytochrome c [Terriglobia bacterium]|nr:cytochrome c [Terriglobia bacterium]
MKSILGKVGVRRALLIAFASWVALAASVATPVAAQNRGATRPKVDRPDGPVWQVIRKNCTQCHGIDDYAFFALDRAGWQSLIETKHKSPEATTAVLSEQDRNLLLDWMVEKFGPKSTPFPRSYVPPEITEFFSDPEAMSLLNRSCISCHSLDRVMTSRNSPDQWRVIAVQMKTRGANVTNEELERLVEWLGRVKGTNANQ